MSDTSSDRSLKARPLTKQAGKDRRRSIGAQRNPNSEQAILEAAEEILLEEGYRGFSIEKVAKRAKAGKPTIYRWWPSKAALLLDVYQRQKQLEYPDTGDVEEDIVQFIQKIFKTWRNNRSGEIFRSMIAEAQSDADASKVLSDYAADRRRHFSKIISRAQLRGEVSPSIDPEVTADWVGSWIWYHLLTNRHDETMENTRKAVRQLTRGMVQKPDP